MNYANKETETFRLALFDGDEEGCAYNPLGLTWKGKHVPYAKASLIRTRGYEAEIEVTITPPGGRGYRNGNAEDEAIWADMRAAGIRIVEGDSLSANPTTASPKEEELRGRLTKILERWQLEIIRTRRDRGISASQNARTLSACKRDIEGALAVGPLPEEPSGAAIERLIPKGGQEP